MELNTLSQYFLGEHLSSSNVLSLLPRSMSKSITDTVNGKQAGQLIIKRALSSEELDSIFRLRYQVYCLEWGFENPWEYPNGREFDEYDEHSIHLIAAVNNVPVGTVRFIKPTHRPFPVEKHCGMAMPTMLGDNAQVTEISRLAVSDELTKDLAIRKDEITVYLIARLFLMIRMYDPRIKYVVAAMNVKLKRRLRRCGIEFHDMGEPVDYHGIRTPCYASMSDIGKGLALRGLLADEGILSIENRHAGSAPHPLPIASAL